MLKTLRATAASFLEALAVKNKTLITVDDAAGVTHSNRHQAAVFLGQLTRRGILTRLRRGLFAVVPVNPLGVYAETKVEAEQIVLANPRHTVVRTSLNGGVSPKRNRGIDEQARIAWTNGQSLRLFTDEYRSPIDASVTARAIWELALAKAAGIFHVAGAERLSRFELGKLLAARWPELSPRIEPASLAEYRGAPRPPDCSMNCAKAQALLSFPLPRYSESFGR